MKRENIDLLSSASLLLAPLVVALYLYIYIAAVPTTPYVESILGSHLANFWQSQPIYGSLLALVLLCGGAVINIMNVVRYNLFGIALQIPLFLYLCYVVGFVNSSDILSPTFAALVGALSVRDLFGSYGNRNRSSKLFTGCFWLGVLPMIYPSTIVVWVAIFVLLMLFEMSLREVGVAIAALIFPLMIKIYVGWLMGGDIVSQISEFGQSIINNYSYSAELWSSSITRSIILGLISAALAAISLLQLGFMSIRFVSSVRLKCAMVLVGFGAAMVFVPSFCVESFAALASPLSIVVTPAIIRMRGLISIPTYIIILLLVAGVAMPLLGL